ncbi:MULTISPECIES: N-acetylmuramoyl-L-alanine amidase [unclassified Blastococcus]
MSAVILVLPVYADPGPQPEPVETSTEEVPMGSVADPAPEAEVQQGTTDPVAGVPPTTPALTVSAVDVEEFSLVGVTWANDPAVTDTVVQIRVRGADGAWGEWTEVAIDDAEQEPGADGGEVRGGSAPLWTGPSTAVEAEVVTRSGAQPTDVQLDLVDPGESAADTSLTTPEIQDTADAAMSMPAVYSRAQWGADETIMGWDPEYAGTTRAATLHHTADTNNYTADQVPAMMRSIYRYHAVSRGWGDIGYNVVVDKFGRLWEGRYGGLARPVVGAHAIGFNTGTFGVSMLGTYETVAVPQAVTDAVAGIIAWKFSLHGVDPRATTTFTAGGGGTSRYPAGARVTLPTIFGHRDVGNTSCPGAQGYSRLGEIREQVASRLASSRGPIGTRYDSDPGLRAFLGAPVGTEQTVNGVTWQEYRNGRIYSSAAGGVRVVVGAILQAYLAAGGPAGMGPPVSDDTQTAGGAYVRFQDGHVYWSPATGARVVRGSILQSYLQQGGPTGYLGFPTTGDAATNDSRGAFVRFQGGEIYWSPGTGTQTVRGAILATWLQTGGAIGWLGFPTSSDAATPGANGFYTRFERGDVYWSAATGPRIVRGSILEAWRAAGGAAGWMGFPTTSDAATNDNRGAFVRFQGGEIYWSPTTGTRIVRGSILTTWLQTGGAIGWLGFPTTSDTPTADGRGAYVRFERGDVYWSPSTGTRIVAGSILTTWLGQGGVSGWLGYPTTSDAATADGRGAFVRFQGGDVYWSPTTGTRYVRGAIRDTWLATGGATGPLGFPTTSDTLTSDGRGAFVRFERGDVYWSPSTGTRVVIGSILATWLGQGGATGYLGFPTTSDTPTADGRGAYVRFQGGDIYWSPTTGTQIVRGSILSTWQSMGGATGVLGFPTTSDAATADRRGFVVRFQGGDVYHSAATGTRAVVGPTAAAYWARGGSASPLGFPTRSTYAVPGGQRTDFQHGSLTWNSATNTVS